MIFAEFPNGTTLNDILAVVSQSYTNLEYGQQGDAWLWISAGSMKVAIDTFSSMQFEVKADPASKPLLDAVLTVLKSNFKLTILEQPTCEGYE